VAVAWAICERTTARQEWIAERLHLKSAGNVSQRVRQYRNRVAERGIITKTERSWVAKWRKF
jgi:hypothetical protein